jgi:hypothetical protein
MGCSGQTTQSGYGQLTGTVTFAGVDCPPGRIQVPPCSGPYPDHEINIYKDDGRTVAAKTISDKDGMFAAVLQPGSYVIYAFGSVSNPNIKTPQIIIMESGKTVIFNIRIDTGIR